MENLGENAKRLPMSLELNTSNKEKRRGVPLYLIMVGGGRGLKPEEEKLCFIQKAEQREMYK